MKNIKAKKDNKTISFGKKKIWLDLVNSPHVPFFKPIIEELDKRGYDLILTARDCFQVCEIADLSHLRYKRIGNHHRKNNILKVAGMFFRALQMAPTMITENPDLALSHGSREQLLVALMAGIPSVLITDYEYSRFLPIVKPNWLITPEIIPDDTLNNKSKNILKYPGIKEDVYVFNFKPDSGIRNELRLNREDLVVTIRPPATTAHYHNRQSEELYKEVISFLIQNPHTRIILLPRDNEQSAFVRNQWPKWCDNDKIIIPDHAVDGLNLIWHSDLMIGGGGTMNREAAALGVPVYSIFRGKIGAIDQYLADRGRLNLLNNVKDIHTKIVLVRRDNSAKKNCTRNNIKDIIVDYIIRIAENILLDHGKKEALNHSNLLSP